MKKYLLSGKYSQLLLGLLFVPLISFSQSEYEENLEKTYSNVTQLDLTHSGGDVNLVKSSGSDMKVVARMTFKANSNEDAEIVKGQFKLDDFDNNGKITLNTAFETQRTNCNNNNCRYVFKDGSKVKNIRNMKREITVYLPDLKKFRIEHKYGKVNMNESINIDEIELNLYSSRIRIPSIKGDVTGEMKYTKGGIGDFANGDVKLYDCNFSFGNGNDLELESKYSDIELGNLNTLDLSIYDDEVEGGNIAGELKISDKYSNIELGDFGDAFFDLYDSDLELKNGNNIRLKSKYTSFKFGEIGTIQFELSYDDEVSIQKAKGLIADTKYTNFTIYELASKLSILSHDDNFRIGKFTGPIEEVDFNGKYTDLDLNMPSNLEYHLEANLTYGKLTYPTEGFERSIYIKENSKTELKGKSANAGANSPTIKIVSYDGKINIQD